MRNQTIIVGSGEMGCGIACCSLLAGRKTMLVNRSLAKAEQGLPKTRKILEELHGYGLCTSEDIDRAMGLLSACGDLAQACAQAELAIESVYENLEVKQDLFKQLDALLPPEVPILSNTSGLRITDIAAKARHPERTLTAHFFLPAHLMPLVEIVVGEHSSRELAERMKVLFAGWGKVPVIVKRDLPGQLAGRIFQAVVREALNIVEMELASAEDVDAAVKASWGLRLPVWGPLEHIDAVGLDICTSVQRTVLPEISNSKVPIGLMERRLKEGNLGYKSGKGIYDWSTKDMKSLMQKRNDFIVHALKKIKER